MILAEIDLDAFWATSRHTSWFEVGMCVCFIASSLYSIMRAVSGGEVDQETVWARALFLFGGALGVAYKIFDSLDVAIIGYLVLCLTAFIDLTISSRAKRHTEDKLFVDALGSSKTHKSSRRHSHRHSDSESSQHTHKHRSRWGVKRSHSHRSSGSSSTGSDGESAKTPRFEDPLADDATRNGDE